MGFEEKKVRMQHCQELRHQIAAREEKALQERRDFLEEGNGARAAIGSERKKLEKIKSRKIEELQKAGVPEKYWTELAEKKSRSERSWIYRLAKLAHVCTGLVRMVSCRHTSSD